MVAEAIQEAHQAIDPQGKTLDLGGSNLVPYHHDCCPTVGAPVSRGQMSAALLDAFKHSANSFRKLDSIPVQRALFG